MRAELIMSDAEIQRILRGRNEDVIAYEMEHAEFVASLASWDVYLTGTYRWPASEDSVRRTSERWFNRQQPGVPVFYGIDPNPSGDGGHHVHSLLATSGGMYRRDAWADWWARYGTARILPLTSIGGVSGYLAKYPMTGSRWWNLLNCHQSALAVR
jgi:hypothetical protein